MYRIYKTLTFFVCGFLMSAVAIGQPVNDECNNAILLDDLANWCSSAGAYTLVDATESPEPSANCFPQDDVHDVWFAFVAEATTVTISVIGNTGSQGGTLNNPQVALYSGGCGAGLVQEECISDAFGNNAVETFGGPLTIGQTYFIRVDARNGNTGTFQLCINNFNQIPDPTSDCPDAVLLCDKSPFTVQSVLGAGSLTNEVDPNSCIQEEISSVWYTWTCDQSGSLTFTLTPSQATDDLDFAVYELPNGPGNCNDKMELRCMASGEVVGQPFDVWEPCTGPTGLNTASTDTEETLGCNAGDDNFVSAINMVSGRSYALIVNNFSNSGLGFSINWGGTGTFLGPLADFNIDPPFGIACEETANIFDASTFDAGDIVSWDWNFGAGAMPATANTQGPHEVFFNSVGMKSVVLTVESDGGCIITKIIQIEIEECCDEVDLSINLDSLSNPNCFGEPGGALAVSATGGTPLYEYSLDGGPFVSLSNFNMLLGGDYGVTVRDIKGCLDSLEVRLIEPPQLLVDAGEDVTIELGYDTDLEAIVSPPQAFIDYSWSPDTFMTCYNCPDPTAFPPNTTTYTVTVLDEDGCAASDDVTISVIKNRPIYIPNAFTPDGDGNNDGFTVYGGRGARQIELLRVFNRWGAMVFEARDIPLGEDQLGWDGTFKGQRMTPDVFAFYVVVEFLDDEKILFEGDVTILK